MIIIAPLDTEYPLGEALDVRGGNDDLAESQLHMEEAVAVVRQPPSDGMRFDWYLMDYR